MNQNRQQLTPFQFAWRSFEFRDYRPCKSTYCHFPYDSLPPIPEIQGDTALHWLTPLDSDIDQSMRKYRPDHEERLHLIDHLREIANEAQRLSLSLPEPFLQVMNSIELQDRIPFCTACYFDLPEKIVPCPGNEDGYLIRFLNDQQFVLAWYLYLTTTGEHCILVAPYSFYILAEAPEYAEEEDITGETQRAALERTYVCSPSFETFLYRFWLENVIWFKLNLYDGQKPLNEEEKRYLAYYKPISSEKRSDA